MHDRVAPVEQRVDEQRDHGRVGRVGALAGPVHVEVAQRDRLEAVELGEHAAVLLGRELRHRVRRAGARRRVLASSAAAPRRRRRCSTTRARPGARRRRARPSAPSACRACSTVSVISGCSTERSTALCAAWWNTTSQPCTASRTASSSATEPITRRARALHVRRGSRSRGRRARPRRGPRATSASTRCEPMKPAPPVTRTLHAATTSGLYRPCDVRLTGSDLRLALRAPARGGGSARRASTGPRRRSGSRPPRCRSRSARRRRRRRARPRPPRARRRRSRSRGPTAGAARTTAPSSRTAASVASTAPSRPLLETARPIVRRPSRIRCTSSSSVSGNASTASRRARRPCGRGALGGARRPARLAAAAATACRGREVDGRGRGRRGGRERPPADDLDRGALVDVAGDDPRRVDRHRVFGRVDAGRRGAAARAACPRARRSPRP